MSRHRGSGSRAKPMLLIQQYTSFERDVAPILKNATVRDTVNELEQRMLSISDFQFIEELVTAFDLLALAYAGSKGFKCNADIARVAFMQPFAKDSYQARTKMLDASMKAMEYHQLAIKELDKQRPESAFNTLVMASNVAETMAGFAQALGMNSIKMIDLVHSAMGAAFEDITSTEKKRRAIELEAQRAEHKATLNKQSQGLKEDSNNMALALASLDIALKALGRSKTVFENFRSYWNGVENHCNMLADVSEMEMVQDMSEEFVEAITDSWYSWLVLGKINDTSVSTMQDVTVTVERRMNDLARSDWPKLMRDAAKIKIARVDQLTAIAGIHAFCVAACKLLKTLEEINDQECSQLQEESRHLTRDLEKASAAHAIATNQLETKMKEKIHHEAALARHASELDALGSAIRQEEDTIKDLRGRINRERQRQSNAAYDLIPFHGIFAAIISGDAKRAIPLYSQIDGIVSAVENELAAATHRLDRSRHDIDRLQQQSKQSRTAVDAARSSIARLEVEAAASQRQIDQCDRYSKATGKRLTKVLNDRMQLKVIQSKYSFLDGDIELVMELEDDMLMENCIEDLHQAALAQVMW